MTESNLSLLATEQCYGTNMFIIYNQLPYPVMCDHFCEYMVHPIVTLLRKESDYFKLDEKWPKKKNIQVPRWGDTPFMFSLEIIRLRMYLYKFENVTDDFTVTIDCETCCIVPAYSKRFSLMNDSLIYGYYTSTSTRKYICNTNRYRKYEKAYASNHPGLRDIVSVVKDWNRRAFIDGYANFEHNFWIQRSQSYSFFEQPNDMDFNLLPNEPLNVDQVCKEMIPFADTKNHDNYNWEHYTNEIDAELEGFNGNYLS